MNRRRRTEILIEGSGSFSKELTQEIEQKYEVQILSEPQHSLTMMKVRETAKRSLFYLGEVLVTETKVQLNGHIGIGIVVGHEEALSYELAVIDAAFEAGVEEVAYWPVLFEMEEQKIIQKKMEREQAILKTKVNFEMMNE